jgi:non-ribosomal peptide synthetase component F
VSEGFAFPYGGCPLCGGELEVFEPGPVADSAAMRAVRKAFEIELGGQAFYHRALASASDPAKRELFAPIAAMEREHMDTLADRYHVDLTPVFDAHAIENAIVFAGGERVTGDAGDLFRVAVDLEERAAAFFQATAARAAPGSLAERLYRELGAEEREHAQLLRGEHLRWRADKPAPPPAETSEPAQAMNAAQTLLAGHDDARFALVCGNQQVTRGELREAVARAGTKWRARGVRRGDRVAIRLPDGIDWVVAYLGVIWAGGVAVGVNPRVPASEWLKILDAAGFLFILAESRDETPSPGRMHDLPHADCQPVVAQAAAREPYPMRADDPAFWVHSSGTSGHPKAVVHPQRAALEVERVGAERLGITAGDRI